MRNSPCAMLITPIWPNVSARPSAASSRMEPPDRPLKTWVTRTSTSAGQLAGPGVGRQVRVRLDRFPGGPLGVDQAVRADLADERGLGDVMVLAAHRDGALRRVVADAVGCRPDRVDVEGAGLLDHSLPQPERGEGGLH